ALVIDSSGAASVPPRTAVRLGDRGLLGLMPGHVPGVALEAKLVTVFPANDEHGLPSHQGLIALFDETTGSPIALLDGTYITAIRTGGTAAVATRVLARDDAAVLAILGAGTQGRSHIETFPRVRDFKEIRVASRNADRARDLAGRNPRAHAVASFEDAVRGADVVACCTDARQPILRREWLQPGAHVSAVGGTFGPEIDAETVRASRVFVEWRGAVTNPPPAGARRLQLSLRQDPARGMDVPVHDQDWLEVLDQAKDRDEADVGRILGVGQAVRRRVRDEHIELAAGSHAFETYAKLELDGAPA